MKKLLFLVMFLQILLPFQKLISMDVSASSPTVFINEFMPNPDGTDAGNEWVELYNISESAVDISGWKIVTKSATGVKRETTILNSSIGIDSYFLVVESDVLFSGTNKFNVGSGKLNMYNDGIVIQLINPTGVVVDEINYGNSTSGKSWERTGPLCFNLKQNTVNHTIGIENINKETVCWPESPPLETTVNEILFSADNINWSQTLNLIGPAQVFIKYVLSNGTEGSAFEAIQLEDNTNLDNPFILENYSGEISITVGSKTYTSEAIAVHSKTLFNEVYKTPEYIAFEIYNPNNFAVDINDYYVTNNTANMTYLESLNIEEYFNISCKNIETLNAKTYCVVFLPTNFIEITNQINLEIADLEVDSFDLLINSEPQLSKIENNWIPMKLSLGSENILENTLLINEIYPSPLASEPEWLEIHNFGDYALNLNGMYLKDKGTQSDYGTAQANFPSILLEPKSYLILNNLAITLNNSGDKITLFDKNNQIIDVVEYSSVEKGKSVGRSANLGSLILTKTPTPGEANVFDEILNLKINEIKNLDANTPVTLIGVVTAKLDVLENNVFYIQDETGGIKVKVLFDAELDILENDKLELFAIVKSNDYGKYLEIKELQDVTKNGIDEITVTNLTEIDEPSENTLVRFSGEIVSNYSTSFDIESPHLTIRTSIRSSTGIKDVTRAKGDTADIVGILIYEDDKYKILPRYKSDITINPKLSQTKETLSAKNTWKPQPSASQALGNSYSVKIKESKLYEIPAAEPQPQKLNIWPSSFIASVIFITVYLKYVLREDEKSKNLVSLR